MEYVFTEHDKKTTDLMSRYPAQDDPDYWKIVPSLFAEEFDSTEKLDTFKDNWIITKVPLVENTFNDVYLTYMRDSLGLILTKYDKEKVKWLELMTEPRDGHSNTSYSNITRTFNFKVEDTNKEYSIDNTSPVRCLRAHNVLTYQIKTGKNIVDYDHIVEIGGGYGDFIKFCRQLGFKGNYYDVDFEPICRIVSHYNKDTENNFFVHDVDDLPELKGKVLVVATWSFSEVPFEYKRRITAKLAGHDWLTTFQANVFDMDNLNYFTYDFMKEIGRRVKFYNIQWHPYQGGNFYAITE